ncbi:unnamed protein product (macronuclear) [Paramecium tetraurelia]|uniref:H-type lectin domain-containing protein n=1 Tax=Paramecium tetraurelia TaxID=5888 RepID=A0BFN8_PARTE|nr:uncharacterized protein GSPATT00028390001 [Paramecium tetraurelia]CAK57355.1 unnamed protein product [Paramecium tetraurelia]|eukprot:XP_001424753.1 hypothetical protein (macronuclear) [Paramecium tetraurelia strain d4-2]
MLILHLALQIFSVNAGHQFESGFFTQFNYAYNLSLILFTSSMKFRSEEFFVPFAQEFSSIPDVYLNIALMDMALQFPQGYSLDITSITTLGNMKNLDLGFTMKTVCESPWLYFGINLNWFAFNDDSVQVINHLNITNPLWQYTHSYIKNLKINVAIANFVSYYAEGPQFNNLTGLSLTDDTVTISLYTNLKQFGYQILLASSDLILVGPTITSTLPYGSSQTVNFPSGWETTMCHPNLLGFYHDGTDFNIRLSGRVSYTSQIDLGFYPWHATIILSIQYNYFCINYAYFDLAIFQGMTQTNYFDTKNEIENHVEIQEMNYNQSQDVEEEIKIPEGIQSIKINYYWKCQENQQLKMQIFCIRDIQQQYTSSNIQCKVGKTNTVRLSAKYLLTTNSQQYLKITKTSASFTATQIIKSSGLFQKLLYKVELIQ